MSTDPLEAVTAVLEKHPYWGPELQRQFQQSGVMVRECRFIRDLFPSIEAFSSALFVIDLDSDLAEIVHWLGTEFAGHSRRIPIIALGSSRTAELEWRLREAGVTAFVPEFVPGGELARLCLRLFRRPSSCSADESPRRTWRWHRPQPNLEKNLNDGID